MKENCGVGDNYIDSTLLPRLKDMVRTSANATKYKFNTCQRKLGFEMMGYDFMLDDMLNPWLIEVNNNPCLEMPCKLLERLIGTVLESTFQIAVDTNFAPPKNLTKKGKEALDLIETLKENNMFEIL